MSPEQQHETTSFVPAPPLRAALGVRVTTSWCPVEDGRIAIEEIFGSDRQPGGQHSEQPVVCLHDAGSGSREFRPLQNNPPIGSRLILFDWPSHGRSESAQNPAAEIVTVEYCAEVLQAVLNLLGVARPILVGSGFGAAVALRYAASHPPRVLGLVLCQPAGLISASAAGEKRRSQLRRPSRKNLTESEAAAHRQALRLEALKPRMAPQRTSASVSLARSESSLRTALESLPIPILFAVSRDSKANPLRKYLALLDPLLAKARQHRFTVFAGDFNPIWDEPIRFSQALTGFIQAQLPFEKHRHAWLLAAVDWPTQDTNLWKCVHPKCPEELTLPTGHNPNDPLPKI